MEEDFPTTLQEKLLNPKKGKAADWLTGKKSEHADAFRWDSNSIKEARAHYFTMHSWDWTHGNAEDLSDIFKELAQEVGLLDESIFKLQWSWKGPEHLQQATYVFQSQTQGTQIPEGSVCQGISKGDGPKGNS